MPPGTHSSQEWEPLSRRSLVRRKMGGCSYHLISITGRNFIKQIVVTQYLRVSEAKAVMAVTPGSIWPYNSFLLRSV